MQLEKALEILGPQRVIGPEQIYKLLKLPNPTGPAAVEDISKMFEINFTEQDLKLAAEQNSGSGENWHLVWILPISIASQRVVVPECGGREYPNPLNLAGTEPSFPPPPCFHRRGLWKLSSYEWEKERPQCGYQLIDFKPRWEGITREGQERKISALGSVFERTHEAALTQAWLAAIAAGEKLPEFKSHWGQAPVVNDVHPNSWVTVENLGSIGISVSFNWFSRGKDQYDRPHKNSGVCLTRMPE